MKKYKLITTAGAILLSMNMVAPAFANELGQEEIVDQAVATIKPLSEETDPIDPTNPIDPIEPVDPIDPTDPIDPVDPVDPTDPIDPVDPVEPEKPVDPVDPTDPTEPEKPVEPNKPVEPEKPVKPIVPTTPVDPVKPVDTIPTPEAPVTAESGQTIVGVEKGVLIAQTPTGEQVKLTELPKGVTKQSDGSLAVKTKSGLKVLPHTGEESRAALSVFGILISGLSAWFMRKQVKS